MHYFIQLPIATGTGAPKSVLRSIPSTQIHISGGISGNINRCSVRRELRRTDVSLFTTCLNAVFADRTETNSTAFTHAFCSVVAKWWWCVLMDQK